MSIARLYRTCLGKAVVPPPPSNTALPTISGTAQQGQTLTASNGTWTNNPTGFTYQWQRCDSAGANCSAITGATSQLYTAASADVGFTLRVAVTASNAGGSSVPAISAQTAVVASAPPISNMAVFWGNTLAGRGGGGFVAGSTMFNFAVSTQLSEVVKAEGGLGHSVFLKANGSVYTAGQNDKGELGQGHFMLPGGFKDDWTADGSMPPIAVTGGVPLYQPMRYWHTPRMPSARLSRPEGPVGPVVGPCIDVSAAGIQTLMLRSDGIPMGIGANEPLGIGWIQGIGASAEAVSQPTAPNEGEEEGTFVPASAPMWTCTCSNTEGGQTRYTFGPKQAPAGGNSKTAVYKTILGAQSGTLHLKPQHLSEQNAIAREPNKKDFEIAFKAGSAIMTFAGFTPSATFRGELGIGSSGKLDTITAIGAIPAQVVAGAEIRQPLTRFAKLNDGTQLHNLGLGHKVKEIVGNQIVLTREGLEATPAKVTNKGQDFQVVGSTAEAESEASHLITDGATVIDAEHARYGALIGPKVATNAWGDSSPVSYEMRYPTGAPLAGQPAPAYATIIGQSGNIAPQMLRPVTTAPSSEPDPFSIVATGNLVINVENWPNVPTELTIYVRQDAVGGHTISLGAGIKWGTDGAPPVNTDARQVGPLTYYDKTKPATDPAAWRYTFNTGEDSQTAIYLYSDGSGNVWAGTPKLCTNVLSVHTAIGYSYFVRDGGGHGDSIWYAGQPAGGIVSSAFARPLTQSEGFAGPDTATINSYTGKPGNRAVGAPQMVELSAAQVSLARMSDNTLTTFGNESSNLGTMGDGSLGVNSWKVAKELRDSTGKVLGKETPKIVSISACEEHCCIADEEGHVYSWGQNEEGECGQGTEGKNVQVTKPTLVPCKGGARELPRPTSSSPGSGTPDPIVMVLAAGGQLRATGVQTVAMSAMVGASGALYTMGGNNWAPKDAVGGMLCDLQLFQRPYPARAAGVSLPVTSVGGRGGGVMLATVQITPPLPPKPIELSQRDASGNMLPKGSLRVIWRRDVEHEIRPGSGFTVKHQRFDAVEIEPHDERLEWARPNKQQGGKTSAEIPLGTGPHSSDGLTYEYIMTLSELPVPEGQETDRLEIEVKESTPAPLVYDSQLNEVQFTPARLATVGNTSGTTVTITGATVPSSRIGGELTGTGLPIGNEITGISGNTVTINKAAETRNGVAITVWGPFAKSGENFIVPYTFTAGAEQAWRVKALHLGTLEKLVAYASLIAAGPGTLSGSLALTPYAGVKSQAVQVQLEGVYQGAFETRTVRGYPVP